MIVNILSYIDSRFKYTEHSLIIMNQSTLDSFTKQDDVTLRYCGCTDVRTKGSSDEKYITIRQFHEDIINALTEQNYSVDNMPPITDVEEFIDDGMISPPDGKDIVLSIDQEVRDGLTENRTKTAHVGQLKYGDEPDGRQVINNRALANDRSGQLGVTDELIPGGDHPKIVNVWAGDGTMAIEYGGYKATINSRSRPSELATDYFLAIGRLGQHSENAEMVDYYEQFREYATDESNRTPQYVDYRTLTNGDGDNRLIAKIQYRGDDGLQIMDGLQVVEIGITEDRLTELNIDTDNIPDVNNNDRNVDTPVVRLIPRCGSKNEYIVKKEIDKKEIQVPPAEPEEEHRRAKLKTETLVNAVKEAAKECGEPLGAEDYREWARKEQADVDNRSAKHRTNRIFGDSDSGGDITPSLDRIARQSSFLKICDEANVKPRIRAETKIEEKLYAILENLDIRYETEVEIEKPETADSTPYRADVLIDRRDLVIEADGDFWHGHPDCYNPDETDENEAFHREKIKHDRKRNEHMAEKGYDVIRFWEDTITTTPETVKDEIERIVKDNGEFEHGKHVCGPEPTL